MTSSLGDEAMTNRRAKQALMAVGPATILVIQLFFFMPLTLYVGNTSEFAVPFSAAFRIWLPLAVIMAGGLTLVVMLLPGSLSRVYFSLVAALSVLVWLQGNLLVWDYGLLDGHVIDWQAESWRGWLDIGIWLTVLVAVAAFSRRLGPPVIRIAVAIFLLQGALSGYSWAQYNAELAQRPRTADASTLENVLRFSSQKNVLQIIADGFQSDIFAELMAEEGTGQRLRAALDGFTYFPENMGVFPYTHMSVPAIFTGQIYRNHLPIDEYMDSTIGRKSILSAAMDAGYEVDLVVPKATLADLYRRSPSTNFYPIKGQRHISSTEFEYQTAARLIDLSLFRVTPHFFKKHIYNDQLWLVQSMIADRDYLTLHFFSHSQFLESMAENLSADRPVPVYKVVHVMLSHRPWVATEQCRYAGRTLPTARETVKNQARCGLIEIVKLLESMKRLGIYDDATIVLMGDHGAWVPPRGTKVILNPDGKSVDHINPNILSLSVPLLAVKRPGDSGPLKANDAPTWIVDTAATIADVAGLGAQFPGTSVFRLNGEEPRKREFNVYNYRRGEYSGEYLTPIEEFAITGSVVDAASWSYVSTHYPGGREERSKNKSALWHTTRLK